MTHSCCEAIEEVRPPLTTSHPVSQKSWSCTKDFLLPAVTDISCCHNAGKVPEAGNSAGLAAGGQPRLGEQGDCSALQFAKLVHCMVFALTGGDLDHLLMCTLQGIIGCNAQALVCCEWYRDYAADTWPPFQVIPTSMHHNVYSKPSLQKSAKYMACDLSYDLAMLKCWVGETECLLNTNIASSRATSAEVVSSWLAHALAGKARGVAGYEGAWRHECQLWSSPACSP